MNHLIFFIENRIFKMFFVCLFDNNILIIIHKFHKQYYLFDYLQFIYKTNKKYAIFINLFIL
jgi:hypothetical protein